MTPSLPEVQVLDVIQRQDAPNCFLVSIMCCYCGKKHTHGTSGSVADIRSLGDRIEHCVRRRGGVFGYELVLDAWHLSKKKIITPKKKKSSD